MSTPHGPSHYDVLRVAHNASTAEIKAAYKQRALECHPDVVPANARTRAEAEFRRLGEAYAALRDEHKRQRYDASLGFAPSAATPPQQRQGGAGPRRMVQREAEAVFAEAFEGRTVHDVIFAARFGQKFGPSSARPSASTSGAHDLSRPWFIPADEAPSVRSAATAVGDRLYRDRRGSDAAAVRRREAATRRAVQGAPFVPPDDHVPYRPFPGMQLPPNVTYERDPAPPQSEYLANNMEMVDVVTSETVHCPMAEATASGKRFGPSARDAAQNARPDVWGQLYSFHRPY